MKRTFLGVTAITLFIIFTLEACKGYGEDVLLPRDFAIKIDKDAEGTVFASKTASQKGAVVQLWSSVELKPVVTAENTTLQSRSVEVFEDGESSDRLIRDKLGGAAAWVYHFKMPASAVTVSLGQSAGHEGLLTQVRIVSAEGKNDVFYDNGAPQPALDDVRIPESVLLKVYPSYDAVAKITYRLSPQGSIEELSGDFILIPAIPQNQTAYLEIIAEKDKAKLSYKYNLIQSAAALPPSSDSALSALDIGGVSYTFSPSVLDYDLAAEAVENGVDAVIITPWSRHLRTTLTLNGGTVASGTGTRVALNSVGLKPENATLINIIVTAEDGTANSKYTVKLYRKQSAEVRLASLVISNPDTDFGFDSEKTEYDLKTMKFPSGTAQVSITPVLSDAKAKLSLNGAEIVSGVKQDAVLSVDGGDANVFVFDITAEDGIAVNKYTIKLYREASNAPVSGKSRDASLKAIAISGLAFSFEPNTLEYDFASMPFENSVSSVLVTPEVNDARASIKIGNESHISGTGKAISLANTGGAPNIAAIMVTAEDGTTNAVYTLKLYRKSSGSAELASLAISNPQTDFNFRPQLYDYDLKDKPFANSTGSITVIPTPVSAEAAITYNGSIVKAGQNIQVTLNNVGSPGNAAAIVVTSADGQTTKKYTLTLYRQMSADASLRSLDISGGELSFTGFAPETTEYSVNTASSGVSNSVTSLTIVPKTAHQGAVIKVENTQVLSGQKYSWALSNTGSLVNELKITVTAQDGKTSRTYTLKAYRSVALSSNANIKAINVTIDGSINKTGKVYPPASAQATDYKLYLSDLSKQIILGVETEHSGASAVIVRNNFTIGGTLAEWASSDLGNKKVTITVTAEDKVTTKSYYIKQVVRSPSGVRVPLAKGGNILFIGDDEVHYWHTKDTGKTIVSELEFVGKRPESAWVLVQGGGGKGGKRRNLSGTSVARDGGGGGGAGQVI
ncbi:MAG: cadherin-like beta sandwich domain-containing protein, partial [Spirochaetaceae bacterium]|nr:cadherin-like beta sandwich domain-containing protein [Spirochaetaceae bacterium]